MERREEENVGEDTLNHTKEDHTHDIPDPGNSESDETGVIDPAEHATENSTAVVSNGKTDDNQNKKDTSQEVPEESDPAQYATGHDTIPAKVLVKTGTSKSKQEPDPGSSAKEKQNIERGERDVPDSVQASVPSLYDKTSASDTSEHSQNLGLQVTEHDNGASQLEGDEGPDEAVVTQLLATLYYTTSPEGQGTTPDLQEASRTMSSENGSTALPTTDSPEVKKSNDESPAATDTSIITSEKTGNTNASRSEGDNRTLASENKQSGSQNLQSESGSSHAGHAGGKGAEETEAQMRDANGRSEEEMKTGSGANKDDKEGQPKKKKAKGEGGTAHAVKTKQRVIKERRVSISLCTSAYSFNVEGLVSYLNGLMKEHPKLIKEVKIHELPYNDLDNYRFDDKDPVDVMILCHSINNRRFAITDVMCALYDEYLPYCARVVGKEKMGVIVHDFDDMRETVQSSRMSSFKYKQPKAFETTSLQITCGHIDKEEQILKQMLKEDRQRLFEFLRNASKHPEKIMTQADIETNRQKAKRIVKQAGGSVASFIRSVTGSNEAKNSSTLPAAAVSPEYPASDVDTGEIKTEERFSDDKKNDNSQPTKRARVESQASSPNVKRADLSRSDSGGDVAQVRQQSLSSQSQLPSSQPTPLTEPRSTSVSICSSAYQHNVKGLLSWFTKFQAKQPHMINDVRFRSLPYNDIDSFRFPPDDPVDVMVLCHSVNNRGFSITNVLNALYEKYLKYCHDVIGKKKLAVIVHDFTDLKPSTVKSRMESFRRSQPLTFDFVDTAIVCGSLEDPAQLGMTEEDKTGLICFLERARLVPEENTELKQSVVGRLKNFFFD